MNKKKAKKLILYTLTLFSFMTVFCLVLFPVKTIDTTLGALSEIEFRLLAKISASLSQRSKIQQTRLLLGSHRGLVDKSSVENSKQSIEAALKSGFRCLEVDISFSADLKPYIYHGPDLALVGQKGDFSNYSSKEIDKWRLTNDQPVITLSRFCHLYANKFEKIYLDIKGDNVDYKKKAKKIWETIENYETPKFFLIGTPWRVIKKVKRTLPHVNIGYEQKGAIANYLMGADMVSLYYKYEFSYAEYKLAKFLGLDVVVWTVNDLEVLKDYSQKFQLTVLTDLNKQEIAL